MGMDSNLHHMRWNPSYSSYTHTEARTLLKICGTAGFKIVSEKGTPNFYHRKQGRQSTIDLSWANFPLNKNSVRGSTLNETFGSDHQAIRVVIADKQAFPPKYRNTCSLKNLKKQDSIDAVNAQLSRLPVVFSSTDEVTEKVNEVTRSLVDTFAKQGKEVLDNDHRKKHWWDKEKLHQLIKTRNRAQRWMTLSQLPQW